MTLERRLSVVAILVGCLLGFEIIAAIFSHSVALLSDVAHVGTDFLSALLTLFAERVAHRPSTKLMSYGFARGTVVAAFVNGFSLILLSLIILGQTVIRLIYPEPVRPGWMIVAALVALFVDGFIIWMLMRGEQNLNIKSAFVHFAGDAMVSLGVILAAVLVALTHRPWFDPMITFILIAVMMYTSWRIVKESLLILMEGTPNAINLEILHETITRLPGILAVHDIHVWAVSDRDFASSLHVVIGPQVVISDTDRLLREIEEILKRRFGIVHTAVQFESQVDPDHHGFPHSPEMDVAPTGSDKPRNIPTAFNTFLYNKVT